jgi:hypothetical protein
MKMFATMDKVKPDRKYKRLKLGDGQACNLSSDKTAVVVEATRNRA